MAFARFVLFASALVFAGTGAAFLLVPHTMAALIGIDLGGAVGATDVRAVYGGLEIAIGVVLAAAARHAHRVVAGLMVQIVLFTGLIAGRIVGLGVDGVPEPPGLLLFGLEVVGLALGIVALVVVGRERSADAPA